jgi:hypothetical protein
LKLYNVKAVAQFLDLSERRIRQLKDSGIIEEYKTMTGLYDLRATTHKYINYLRRRNPESEENIDYNTERAKLVRAKRKDMEYDLGLKERQLHTSVDVEIAMTSMLVNFKSRLMAVPAKLSPLLSKKTDKAEIHRILKDAIDEALDVLSDFGNTFGAEGDKENETGNI